jgi:hypothetical protein
LLFSLVFGRENRVERKISLKEREIALRRTTAEVEAIELANEKLKLDLEKSKL